MFAVDVSVWPRCDVSLSREAKPEAVTNPRLFPTSYGATLRGRLMVHPVVVGGGKRLFEDWGEQKALELVDSKTFATGVVYLTYRKAVGRGAERDHG